MPIVDNLRLLKREDRLEPERIHVCERTYAAVERFDRSFRLSILKVITLNRLDESMLPELAESVVNMTAIFQIKVRRNSWVRLLHEKIVQRMLIDCIN